MSKLLASVDDFRLYEIVIQNVTAIALVNNKSKPVKINKNSKTRRKLRKKNGTTC